MEEWYRFIWHQIRFWHASLSQVKSNSNSNVNVKSQALKFKVTRFESTMKPSPHNASNQRSCHHCLLLKHKVLFQFPSCSDGFILATQYEEWDQAQKEDVVIRELWLSAYFQAGHADLCSIITESATKGNNLL